MSKVLVLQSSARKKGHTSVLAEAFIKGALKMGHQVESINVHFLEIKGCLGCRACQNNGGRCIQKDEMINIYSKLHEADIIVLASPVYFYTWNAQMKAVLDRMFAVEKQLQNKTFYLITTGAALEESYFDLMKASFEKFVMCFRAGGNAVGGYILGAKEGDSQNEASIYIAKAYELGQKV